MTRWLAAAEQEVRRLMDARQVPGLAVGVTAPGHVPYVEGFGWRDREAGLAVTPDTVFGIGSITKSLTAVAILQLMQEGRLDVNDPVIRYLPEFATPNAAHTRAVTLHHLLTHTAGLPPLPTLSRALMRSMDAAELAEESGAAPPPGLPIDTGEELLEALGEMDYDYVGRPGERFSYSNEGYALLGLIVERLSGLSYPDYLDQRVFGPLDMTRSFLHVPGTADEPVSMLYNPGKEDGQPAEAAPGWWQAPSMLAAGFVRSTVRDLIRYLDCLLRPGDGTVLSPESRRLMLTGYVPCFPGAAYGYGFWLESHHGHAMATHGGNLKGVAASVRFLPEAGIGVAALTNLSGGPAGVASLSFLNDAVGLAVSARPTSFPATPPPPRLWEFAGTYRSMEGEVVEVRESADGLTLTARDKSYEAWPAGPDLFAFTVDGETSAIEFVRRADGTVFAITWGLRVIARETTA
jgi:CubicO group peptidase (beta-lactamase class C family)